MKDKSPDKIKKMPNICWDTEKMVAIFQLATEKTVVWVLFFQSSTTYVCKIQIVDDIKYLVRSDFVAKFHVEPASSSFLNVVVVVVPMSRFILFETRCVLLGSACTVCTQTSKYEGKNIVL